MDPDADVVVIDEIGKMECKSALFVNKVIEVLNSKTPVVATINERNEKMANEIKSRNDVKIIRIDYKNRDEIPGMIFNFIREILK